MFTIIITSIALSRNNDVTKVKFIVLSLMFLLHVIISTNNVFFNRYFSIMTINSYAFAFVMI